MADFNPLAGLPIFPGVNFDEGDYASLKLRLDLYNDMVVATRYHKGTQSSYVVDPLALAQAVADVEISTGLLPENILFWQRRNGQERLGLWLPPRVWSLRTEPTDSPNRRIPLPGLVFVGRGLNYSLYALAETGRPGLRSRLYAPPCPNVSEAVCQGNVAFPVAGVDTIEQAATAFLESGFNNHLGNGKSKKYPEDILRMWRVLHRARATAYPVRDLVPREWRLQELVEQGS